MLSSSRMMSYATQSSGGPLASVTVACAQSSISTGSGGAVDDGSAVGSGGASVAAGAWGGAASVGAATGAHAARIWLNTRSDTTKIIFQFLIFFSFISCRLRKD